LSIIKKPLLMLLVLAIIGFIFNLLIFLPGGIGFNYTLIGLITIPMILIDFFIFVYMGYMIAKNYSADLETVMVSGAIAGGISTLVSAVLVFLVSVILAFAGEHITEGLLFVIFFIAPLGGIITYPIFGAIRGAILAAIGGFIAGARSGYMGSEKRSTVK
jgi:hypothetical protein